MQFNVKFKDKKDRVIEFIEIEELIAFIMGCDTPVKIIPDWSSPTWDMEVMNSEEKEET